LSDGDSANSQPENTRRTTVGVPGRCTVSSTCTNAPDCFGFTHGGVVSQVAKRIASGP
jgi:hypothetical protein